MSRKQQNIPREPVQLSVHAQRSLAIKAAAKQRAAQKPKDTQNVNLMSAPIKSLNSQFDRSMNLRSQRGRNTENQSSVVHINEPADLTSPHSVQYIIPIKQSKQNPAKKIKANVPLLQTVVDRLVRECTPEQTFISSIPQSKLNEWALTSPKRKINTITNLNDTPTRTNTKTNKGNVLLQSPSKVVKVYKVVMANDENAIFSPSYNTRSSISKTYTLIFLIYRRTCSEWKYRFKKRKTYSTSQETNDRTSNPSHPPTLTLTN